MKPFNFHTFISSDELTETKEEKLPMQVHAHSPTPMYKHRRGEQF